MWAFAVIATFLVVLIASKLVPYYVFIAINGDPNKAKPGEVIPAIRRDISKTNGGFRYKP